MTDLHSSPRDVRTRSRCRRADSGKFLARRPEPLPVLKLRRIAEHERPDLARRSQGAARKSGSLKHPGDRRLTTHDQVSRSPEVQRAIPALAVEGGIGDAQSAARGTRGSVAHADPAADYPAAILGLGAKILTDDERSPADDFFTGRSRRTRGRRAGHRVPSRWPGARVRQLRHARRSTRWSGVFVAEDRAA